MRTLEDVLEEITPVPDPDFVADMEWRFQHGFPPQRKRRRLPNLRPRQFAAVAASAGLAAVVAVALVTSGDEAPTTTATQFEAFSAGGATESAAPVPEPASPPPADADSLALRRAVGDDSAIVGPGGGNVAPGARVRRIERLAQLTLASDPDEFDALSDAIFRTADRHDGFVLQSSFTQGEEGFSSGFFELRVPAGQLQQTLNELSGLATVRARSESGTDVTGSFVSIRDRLRTARALRISLLRRLELAVTDTAVNALRRRLGIVGNRIGRLRSELRGMRERTEYATVLVELVDEDAGATVGETDEAVDDAVGSFEDILNFLIRAAGVLVPIALAGGIAWLVLTRARRRARERALA